MHRRLITTYRAAFADLPRAVWQLAVVTLIHRAGTMVLPFLILYLTSEHGIDDAHGYRVLWHAYAAVALASGGAFLITDRWARTR